jgi:IS30 family transposase
MAHAPDHRVRLLPADSGVKRNIPGRCGNALAGNHDPGWCRAASTVSRELRRDALPRGGHLPVHAEGCYLERRQRPAVLERRERLGRFVRERLLEGWTPERIAGWLKRGEERGLRPVSLETIYAFIHRPG